MDQFVEILSIAFQHGRYQFSRMEREVEWIRRALARNRDKTQTGLAQALNLDKSSVSRLLRGERRLKFSEARLAAAYLGVEPPAGFTEGGGDYQSNRAAAQTPSSAALFRVDVGSDGFWLLDRETVVETRPRSQQLTGVPSAFGFYVPDAAMAPRFQIGEVAWVNPDRPAATGDDALMIRKERCGDLDMVLLCEIRDVSHDGFSIHQHGVGGNTRTLPRSDWNAYYVFPRT